MISKLKKVLLGIAVSAGIFTPTASLALDGTLSASPSFGDNGNCSVTAILDNAFLEAQIIVGNNSTFDSRATAGTSYLFGGVAPGTAFNEAFIASCFTGASAGDITNLIQDGADSTYATDDELGLSFDFGGNTYRVAYVGVTGTTFVNTVTLAVPPAPEINVQGNSNDIVSGDTTPSAADDTELGLAQVNINTDTVSSTFTIQNTGTAVLNITGITSSNSLFAITGASPTVAAGGSETFNVVFDPVTTGTLTSTIQITSNDADEGTYSFVVSAIGVQPTAMTQKRFNPDSIVQGGSTTLSYSLLANNITLPSTNVGFTDDINSVIPGVTIGAPTTNTCNGTLTTTGGVVSLSGASFIAGLRGCQIILPVTIPAGAAVGTVNSITSQIASTIGGENFTRGGDSDLITILAPTPQINVQGNGIDIADEDTSAQAADGTFVGTVPFFPFNSTASSTFTIQNPGTAVLNISSITTNNGEFTVSGAPTSVAAGGSETFTVTFDPQFAGNRFGFITIFNDASSDGNWRMRLQGLATEPNAVITSSSGNGPFSEGDTDAQGNQLVGVPTTVTFTITNNGNEQLQINGATSAGPSALLVNVDSNIVIGQPSLLVIPAGSSTTTSVTYTPTAVGAFSFPVSIRPLDPDLVNATIRVNVSGTAIANPEIGISSSESGPVNDGGTDDHGAEIAGAAKAVTYTITNTGTDALTLTDPTVAGNVSGQSNVIVNSMTLGSTSVAAGGGTTTLVVNYTPNIAGAFSFDLSLPNNDADENPFNITASGTATGTPDVEVLSINGAIADGGTDDQGSRVSGTPVAVTYTVLNSGTDTLTLTGVNLANFSNVAASLTTSLSSLSLAPVSGTATFTVTYTPTIAGAFSFDIDLASDDPDENPFDVTVSGTATGDPEIAISSSVGGAIADGGTDAQGSRVAGTPVTVTYTISNTGTDVLDINTISGFGLPTNATFDGLNIAGLVNPLPAGGNTTFTATYTPTNAGPFSVGLGVISDDADESPYNITIAGTATGAPEIEVSSSIGGAITDGGTDAQGNSRPAGTNVNVTYTIRNTGTDTLTIMGAPTVSNLNNVSNVIPGSVLINNIAPGGSQSFLVSYTPTFAGNFSFDLDILSNDGDENPFDITVSGTADGMPEIAVTSSVGGVIADSGTDDQGSRVAGNAVSVTYTVTNSGLDTLTLSAPTISGQTNVSAGVITPLSSTSIAPSGSATFTVLYSPAIAGAFDFDIRLGNDDADENPYDISVSGTATGTPEIAVSSSSNAAISDGGNDGQGNRVAGTPVDITYTVTNTGTDTLTLTAPTISGLSNTTASVTTALSTTSVAPAGGTATFTVTYTPTISGVFSFDIDLGNNDADENPFDIAVSGNATGAPEIELSSSIGGAVADGDFNTLGNSIAGVNNTVTYTITNTGTDTLSLNAPVLINLVDVAASVTTPLSSTSLAPSGSTTFVVTYSAPLAGTFSFGISLRNNDSDENPYNIAAVGLATGDPEIDVSSSVAGAILDGGTDAQGSRAAGSNVNVTYTINNTGTDTLNITGVPSVSNVTNIGGIAVNPLSSNSIAPGASATFLVSYTPSIAGAFSFDLDIVNDDVDENPYDIAVSGTASGAPEIAVSSSISGVIADGGTDAQGVQTAGGSVTVTYTITNTGTDTLTLGGTPTVTGTVNTGSPVVSVPSSLSLPPVFGSATFTVTYEPADIGAFSFDLDILSNDADETPYDILLSGTGTAVPPTFTKVFTPDTILDNETSTLTYTIDNTANFVSASSLNFTNNLPSGVIVASPANTNTTCTGGTLTAAAGTATISYSGGTVSAGVSCTLSVDIAAPTAGTFASTTGDLTSSLGNSGTASDTLTVNVSDAVPPTVEIMGAPASHDRSTPFTVTVQFSEDVQNFAVGDITVANATLSNFVTVDANTYTVDVVPSGAEAITLDIAAGVAEDIAGNDNMAAGQVSVRSDIVEQTQEVISSFLQNRANHILSNQPSLIGFVTGQNNSGGGPLGSLALDGNEQGFNLGFFTSRSKILESVGQGFNANGQSGLSGNRVSLLRQDAQLSDDARAFADHLNKDFANSLTKRSKKTSLSSRDSSNKQDDDAISYAADLPGLANTDESLALGDASDGSTPKVNREGTWDVWASLYGSASNSGSSDSSLWVGYLGAHYFLNDHTLVGVLGQLDWADESNSAFNSEAEGFGWMIGPYIAGQLPGQNLYYEARVAYGESDNDVSPIGTFVDSFDTTRFLATGAISGDYALDEVTRFSPRLSVAYFEETQESYVDSLGNTIPEQTISLGELKFGPSFTKTLELDDGAIFTPSVGISGVYNFAINDNVSTQGFALGDDNLRARIDAGFTLTNTDGMSFSLEGFYDGIGADDFESYGGTAKVTIPLN